MSFYQVCCVCKKKFPPLGSTGFGDNKCADCSGPRVYYPMNILTDPVVTAHSLSRSLRRSRRESHKEPEGRDESPPPGQEDEHRLERHPNTAGLPGPTDTVEITEEGLEPEEQLPPEAHEAVSP